MNKISNFFSIINQSRLLVRNYAIKSDLKIKWVRPEKISCIKPQKSGDLSGPEKVQSQSVLHDFQGAKGLEDASDIVKQIFSIEHNRYRESKLIRRNNMVQEVQRHEQDYGSMEAKLGDMTARIRHLQEYMDKHPRNTQVKVFLKELIDKRKRFLRYLRRWDYKRFEWILEKLDLVYKAYPTHYHWITRKESMRKLTNLHCEKIRNERLDAYRNELESQQVPFLENKVKRLQMIQDEQKELKLPITVTDTDIKLAKRQLQDLLEKKKLLEKEIKEN